MVVLPTTVVGAGVPVLVVHGIGVGAPAYDALVEAVAAVACAVVPDRRGYHRAADLAPTSSWIEQVDDLLETAATVTAEPVVWLGVSGGATLGLGALVERPHRIRAAVLHEPLVGMGAPRLHEQVVARRATLRATPGGAAATAFVRSLIGEDAWERIADDDRCRIDDLAAVIRREVEMFVDIDFDEDALRSLAGRARLITTVGAQSPQPRDHVARLLALLASADVEVLAGGHLAPLFDVAATTSLVCRAIQTPRPPDGGTQT